MKKIDDPMREPGNGGEQIIYGAPAAKPHQRRWISWAGWAIAVVEAIILLAR